MKRFNRLSRHRFLQFITGISLMLSMLSGPAYSAELVWNGGLSGVWQQGGGGWLDSATPASWNSATPDSALFAGALPSVVLVDPLGLTAGTISVTDGNYLLSGTGTLDLATGLFMIMDGSTCTVEAAVSGTTGLAKTGAGLLILSNTNKNFSGGTTISEGAIFVSSESAGSLGTSATASVALDGGALYAGFTANVTPQWTIDVGASGGEIRNLAAGRWQISSANRLSGSGELTLSFGTVNTRFILQSAQDTFSGSWVLDSAGNFNRIFDVYPGFRPGSGTGTDFYTLRQAGLLLRDGVVLGSTTQGITLASGVSRLMVAGSSTATVAGCLSGDAANGLEFWLDNSTAIAVLTNPTNNWLGETTLRGSAGGVLRLGASGVLPNSGGNVVINTGLVLDLNGYDEAIGGLFGTGLVDTRAAGTATLTVGANNNSPTFSGTITNSGIGSGLNLIKVGTGIQSLSGANTIPGYVSVMEGTLALSGSSDLAASTSVTVNAGATILSIGRSDGTLSIPAGQVLTGSGTVIGILTNEGVVAPSGWLTHTGNYIQTSSGTLRVSLSSTTSHDGLRSSGSAWLDGSLDVSLNGYTPVPGDSFTVMQLAGRSGTFATTNLPSLSQGFGWVVNYLSTGVVVSVTGAPPVTGYDAWAAAITNGLTNYWESATDDGYANLLKYATGSSPTNSDNLPRLQCSLVQGTMVLGFNRNTNATDVVIEVQGSEALGTAALWVGISSNIAGLWNPPLAHESSGNPASVTITNNQPGLTSRFFRLSVSP